MRPACAAYWARLADAEQRMPRIARAAAQSLIALGGDREAAEILAKSLERHWNPDLVRCTRNAGRRT